MSALSLDDCRGCARAFLQDVGLDGVARVDPFGALRAANVHLSARAPRGCGGFLVLDDDRIVARIDTRGHPSVAQQRGGHECGHLALLSWGVPWPHDEPSVDRIGLLIRMPEQPFEQVLDAVGERYDELARVYRDVSPTDLYTRVALARRGYAVLYIGRSEHFVANDARVNEPLALTLQRNALRDAVYVTGRPAANDNGVFAAPFDDPSRGRGIVVVVPHACTEDAAGGF